MSAARGGFWVMVPLLALALALGLASVWMNIERVDLAYTLKKMEHELSDKSTLADKLGVERDNLMAPYQLKRLADKFGLGPAGPGQIRRLNQAEEAGTANP
ncbi:MULTISPECIES: hypothetical protein [Desulfovibrio]|uniref:hypothetical protein n=1 Tax=Desulfovibrio TaxID=872 RepID=UPI000489CC74|nr:hypothetical protein [Desulfovibrio sp.]MDY0307096.1 hypothetical protein [Desulfovibrionaceae bacterium]